MASDVIKKLVATFDKFSLSFKGIGDSHMSFSLRLSNDEVWPIYVTPHLCDEEGRTWCFVSDGISCDALRFVATKFVDVPTLFETEQGVVLPVQELFNKFEWFTMWPKSDMSVDDYASRLYGHSLRTTATMPVSFFSESLIVGAIKEFLTICLLPPLPPA